MDLAAGAGRVVVLTRHRTRSGASKLVQHLDYPLTAAGVVSRVITELGIFDVTGSAFQVVRLAPGVSMDAVSSVTGAALVDGVG